MVGVGGFFTIDRQLRCTETPRHSVPSYCRFPRLCRLKCVKSSLPGRPRGKKNSPEAAGPGKNTAPKTRKNQTARTSGSSKPAARVQQPNISSTPQDIHPDKSNDTLQDRREYDKARSKSPERMEYNRRLAQEQRQKAKELGQCRNCSRPAILNQTRCPTCAEAHRQSRGRSDARRRAAAKRAATTDRAGQ